ncbi:MAG: alpha/beta hydrolase [Verrucomicrobia bacterium]|nr:alpha/beta hydrolase [Verrucomicrobiota bacterium]
MPSPLWALLGALLLVLVACERSPATSDIRENTAQIGDLAQRYRTVGQGPPLLLVHGLTNTWRIWRPYMDTLAEKHWLIIPDLRGHGDTKNPASTLTEWQVARDMLALLDTLGVKQVQLVGFSFGGHVALRMAALQPERVEAMIVIAGAHQLLGPARKTIEDNRGTNLPQGWYLDVASTWHPAGEVQVQQLWREGVASALGNDFGIPDELLAAIRARTLVIQGDRDDYFPLDVPLDLYRKIQKAQLWIIPNTTHATVFFQDVAPSEQDFGGGRLAARIFPEVIDEFLAAKGSQK